MTQGCCQMCSAATTTQCSGCRQIFYCSKECQLKDWAEHKKLHQVQDCVRLSYPGEWSSSTVYTTLDKRAYLIIKLENKEDIQTIKEFREASSSILNHPDLNGAVAALSKPPTFPFDSTGHKGYVLNPEGLFYIDFRTENTMTQLYPDPNPNFFKMDFKKIFFKAYNLMADITEKLLDAIIDQVEEVTVFSYSRWEGASLSAVRILNYQSPRCGIKPHIDTAKLPITIPGQSVGLAVYDPSKDKYVYPEYAIKDLNSELLVICGMELAENTMGRMKPTKHRVNIKAPRESAVFAISPGMMFMSSATEDYGFEEMVSAKYPEHV